MIPELCTRPGIVDVHVGRQGPGQLGRRVVASLWQDEASLRATLGETIETSPFHPEHLRETMDREVATLPVRVHVSSSVPIEPGILRIVHGRVRAGEVAAYAGEVQAGTDSDIEEGGGPSLLVLADAGDDAFVTFSVWPHWAAIERATGSDVRQPL